MKKQNDDLLNYLHTQIKKAKKHTTPFIERNKRDVNLYESKHIATPGSYVDGGDVVTQYNSAVEKRYSKPDRMIFTNTEGAKATIFDRVPELIFKARNQSGDEKRQIVNGVYEYLKDKLDLYGFAIDSLHWFVLSGFSCAYIDYMVNSYEAQAYDEAGNELFREDGSPETYTKYDWDDPVLSVGDPKKNYYAPASKFSVSMDKVPYNVREESIDVDQIKIVYGEVVDADYMEESGEEKDNSSNLASVWFICGNIPEAQKEFVEDWEVDAEYYIVITKKKVLYKDRRKRRQSKIVKWYSHPNKFFGFGFGTIGESYQLAKEQRKGQLSRAADTLAFPKIAIKNGGDETTNPEDWKDPRENMVVLYEENKPEYLTPPSIGDSVQADLQQNESDSQSAFGMLDISTGSQESSTIQTATGQTIFAEAAQKRLKYGKRLFMAFYREVIIELFKQCQENWVDPKPITITDEDGNTEEIMVTKEHLADIDFDKDLDIDAESVGVNKDVMREQMIALYDKVKDDPIVDRKQVFTDMLRKGFNINNPDRYIKEASGVEPGTPLVNPDTGEQFVVGEAGEVVSQQSQQEMAQPGGDRPPQTQAAALT